ncbi:hypothetical protein CDL15_Pgr029199 [Punica granatum]|nr:hypothetical protein CDL15_Pgr029199 [Punica granatum]
MGLEWGQECCRRCSWWIWKKVEKRFYVLVLEGLAILSEAINRLARKNIWQRVVYETDSEVLF